MGFEGWRVELLGGFQAVRGDACVTKLRTRNAEVLLAMLAAHPTRVWARTVLGENLWPGELETTQRERLRYHLSKIGAGLGEEVFTRNGNTSLQADPTRLTSDVVAFESAMRAAVGASPTERLEPLREAVRLYKDDLLPGFYDEWSCAERERLKDVLFDAITRLILDLESVGRTDEARTIYRDAVQRFPERVIPSPSPATSAAPTTTPLAPGHAYFGRDAEKEAVRTWAGSGAERVLTIAATGGMGKTRLSREALGDAAPFVSLAELFDAGRLFEALHGALGLPPHQGDPYIPLVAHLKGQPKPLLILDNLEQLVEGAAPLLARLLRDVPNLKLLVTSRKPLKLPTERVFALNPLPDEPSVMLFLDRARLARPDFPQSVEALSLVREIVQLLEGLPLAIELAAARTVVLGPRQILNQLQSRLSFLVNRRHAPVKRHGSLRAALDWSFDLLSPALQEFFARLSVFRGGFTLEAAEAVAGECVPSTVDAIDDLHAHSLLTVRLDDSGEARYDLLVVIREYAEEALGDDGTARTAHAAYFDVFTERCQDETVHLRRIQRLLSETDNLRAAFTVMRVADAPESGLRLVRRLAGVFFEAGHWRDMTEMLDWAQSCATLPEDRSLVLSRQGGLARRQGREDDARRAWEACAEIEITTKGAGSGYFAAVHGLATQCLDLGDAGGAERYAALSRPLPKEDWDEIILQVVEVRLADLLGDSPRAERLARDAYDRALQLRTPTSMGGFSLMISILPVLGRITPEEALRLGLELLEFYTQENFRFIVARLAQILGTIYRSIGKQTEAEIALFLGWSLHESIGSRYVSEARSAWEALQSPPPSEGDWRSLVKFLTKNAPI